MSALTTSTQYCIGGSSKKNKAKINKTYMLIGKKKLYLLTYTYSQNKAQKTFKKTGLEITQASIQNSILLLHTNNEQLEVKLFKCHYHIIKIKVRNLYNGNFKNTALENLKMI